jgi:uncharacterized protein YggU (UPF0235/DUF167 family)
MLIHVKVEADSNREFVEEIKHNSYRVFTKEKAENNQANKKMVQLLATYLGKRTFNVRIVTGHHSPSKIVDVIDS